MSLFGRKEKGGSQLGRLTAATQRTRGKQSEREREDWEREKEGEQQQNW